MATPIIVVLLCLAAGTGLCVGYLLGHQAAHERAERRGQAVRRYRQAFDDHPDDIERVGGAELRPSDLSLGVRFHR